MITSFSSHLLLPLLSSLFSQKTLTFSVTLSDYRGPLLSGVGSDKTGMIPAGTVVYEFKHLPEVSLYFMFFNLKYMQQLEPYEGEDKFNLVMPVSAFPENVEEDQ